jgi:hypothetical protein
MWWLLGLLGMLILVIIVIPAIIWKIGKGR